MGYRVHAVVDVCPPLSPSLSLSLSLTHTHTHTHIRAFFLSLVRSHSLSLSLSLVNRVHAVADVGKSGDVNATGPEEEGVVDHSLSGATRADDAQGTPIRSHIPPNKLLYP